MVPLESAFRLGSILIVTLLVRGALAFLPPPRSCSLSAPVAAYGIHRIHGTIATTRAFSTHLVLVRPRADRRTRSLMSAPLAAVSPPAFPVPPAARAWILLGAAIAALAARANLGGGRLRRALWPGSSADPSRPEPLPPGPLGCPFIGRPFFLGSRDFGVGGFHRRVSMALGLPRLWTYYFMGRPFAVLSGGDAVASILGREFRPGGLEMLNAAVAAQAIVPMESVMFESDETRHSSLRRLVGTGLTPTAVAAAVPSLRTTAEDRARRMITASVSSPVKMEDVCTDFTLDVAWKQILGLRLTEEEVPKFREAVGRWCAGMMSPRIMLNIRIKSSPSYRAKLYLESMIEEKIRDLERNGPDASTLSGMVFATDEEDSSRKLTRREMIDNALILILAGSETSASALTNAMLFLGLHRQAWNKLIEEQRAMQNRHGDDLSLEALDKECPYLEAVIKETLRMRPVFGAPPRLFKGTMVVDGKQIPKGWGLDASIVLTHELDPITYKQDGSHMDVKRGFVPERWLSDETKPTNDFIPMSVGPRRCLGVDLAFAEMKVFLAVLARNIDFELAGNTNEVKWKRFGFIPRPADGVHVIARKQETTQL